MRSPLRVVLDFLGGFARPATNERVWVAAAKACGVENVVVSRPSLWAVPRLEGARPPLTIAIHLFGDRFRETAIVTVGGVSKSLRLQHETLRTKLGSASEIVLGDPEFDAQFFVGGETLVARALFDATTRRLTRALFGRAQSVVGQLLSEDDDRGDVKEGVLRVPWAQIAYPDPATTPAELLGRALELAGRLVEDDALEQRLAAIARTDPLPAVRRAALTTLRDERPRHPATQEALEAACEDEDSDIRLLAASALGTAKGQPTLLDLASSVDAPDDVSARAVRELRRHLPGDRARAILTGALRARRLQTAAACVDSLSRGGSHADLIARVLAVEGGGLAIAAADALGRCGTPAHVAALRDVEAQHPRDDALASACRAAVAAIHVRQPGASPGQLSLAADAAGRVSIADDAVGQVSLADDAPTRRDRSE